MSEETRAFRLRHSTDDQRHLAQAPLMGHDRHHERIPHRSGAVENTACGKTGRELT